MEEEEEDEDLKLGSSLGFQEREDEGGDDYDMMDSMEQMQAYQRANPDAPRTQKEIMNEVIAKSKYYKALHASELMEQNK